MSYLTTIVHPLIIIRLLQHRLFTPLLKKTNSRAMTNNSVSLLGSVGAGSCRSSTDAGKSSLSNSLNQTSKLSQMSRSQAEYGDAPVGILKKNQKISKHSGSSSPPPSTNKNKRTNRKFSQDQFPNMEFLIRKNRKSSQISLNNNSITTDNKSLTVNNPNVKMEFIVTDMNSKNPSHHISSNNSNSTHPSPTNTTKTTYLKDLSKKILKRVNSNYSRKSKNHNSAESDTHQNRLNSLANEISLDPISSISTNQATRGTKLLNFLF